MLTEDYYVANKLMKEFFYSANIDTNSMLCMASTGAGHRRAFGTDTVPGTYEDLEQAPCARISALIAGQTDPISGQPELKAAVVSVAPYPAAWYGFAVSASDPAPQTHYSAKARVGDGWRMKLADITNPADWKCYARPPFCPARCHGP